MPTFNLCLTFQTDDDEIISFFKARAAHFYNGSVKKINFENYEQETKKLIESKVKFSIGQSPKPMSAFSTNYFQVQRSN